MAVRQATSPEGPAGCGRFALVTGAASGLGRALAQRLASEGWTLALADCDAAGNLQTLESLAASAAGENSSDGHTCHALDVADADAWQRLRHELRGRWPRIDVLINCAGVCGAGEVGDFPLADWRWLLETNLFGVIHGCHVFVPWLRENPGRAQIVNIASVAAIASAPSMAAYNVAKAGVLALSETMYAELRPHGVGVTVVCPGFFATRLLDRGRFSRPEHLEDGEKWVRRSTIDAERVAVQIIRAVNRRRLYLVVPWRARLLWRAKRLLPTGVLRLTSHLYRRSIGGRASGAPAPADPDPLTERMPSATPPAAPVVAHSIPEQS